jgi:hypothetical protein
LDFFLILPVAPRDLLLLRRRSRASGFSRLYSDREYSDRAVYCVREQYIVLENSVPYTPYIRVYSDREQYIVLENSVPYIQYGT